MSDYFYTTYNARHSAPKEVAETFVLSENYLKIIQNNHSVLLGARGCGKTTLMKMLTIPALNNWNHEKAEKIKNNIPFYSVYISTDIYWDVKKNKFESQLDQYEDLSFIISNFSVCSNVFSSLCDTFLNIIEYYILNKDEQKEIELCEILKDAWKLKSVIPKLEYIKKALNDRIDDVNQMIQNLIFNYKAKEELPHYDYFNLTFDSSLERVIPEFERIYNLNDGKKWALCFDELEFAPSWLQNQLFLSLRSRKQYILYKLSSSPILSSELVKLLKGEYKPSPGNDLDLIKMWVTPDSVSFSKEIIQSMIGSKNINEFFGSNVIYSRTNDSYNVGSTFYNEMIELIDKDDSFKNFLISKGVDISRPVPKDTIQKDTIFRKIKPIVFHRNASIASNKKNKVGTYDIKLRSRKSAANLYHGIEVLSKVCDGNPRWLIGIVSQILNQTPENRTADSIVQYDEIINAARRFKNVMDNIPIGNSGISLTHLITRICNYMRNQISGKQFNMDPKGTFIIDFDKKLVQNDHLQIIEKGISQGAFILVDSNDGKYDFKVQDQRIKISYLYFVLYGLPLRKYNSVKLSESLIEGDSATEQFSLFK